MRYKKRIPAVMLTFLLVISMFSGIPGLGNVEASQNRGAGEETVQPVASGDASGNASGDASGGDTGEEPSKPERISAVKQQTVYFVGDAIAFDDVAVKLYFSDGKETALNAQSDDNPDGYTLEGTGDIQMETAGEYTVTVRYKEFEAAITITVKVPPQLTGITAKKTKTDYTTDDTLSWDDLTVTAEYSDGTTKTVTGYKIGECDISTVGQKEVTITYTEGEGEKARTQTTAIIITVKDILTSLKVEKAKKKYTVDDKLNIDDLKVWACYNNNSNHKRELTTEEYTTDVESVKMYPAGTRTLTISYTEDGVTKTATVKISVKVPDVPVVDGVRTVNVLRFGAKNDDVYSDKIAIQDALNVAASADVPLVVYFPNGTYYIGGPLYIHSNTTIRMEENAVILRNSELVAGDGREGIEHNMLKAASSGTTTTSKGGYDNVKNIVIEGGTWDGGEIARAINTRNLINIGHAENVVIRNTTIKNCYGSHLIELAGVKNAEIYGCYFTGFRKESGGVDSEAIQLDVCYGDWNTAYKVDNTPCVNISVHDNTFVNYPVSVGNHHLLNGYHNNNITVTDNKISNTIGTGYQGIHLYGCDNSTAKNNSISGFENGVRTYGSTSYTVENNTISNCEFGVVSAGGSTGSITKNTISNTKYQGIFAYDGTKVSSIKENRLENVGIDTSKPRDGIAVCGYGSSVDTITKNTITKSNRYGIYVYSGAKVPKITSNTISNTSNSGILVSESKTKPSVKSNKLTKVGSNAVKIKNTSYVKQTYTFAPKVKKLNLKTGRMEITASHLKKVQLKFASKSYSKSTGKSKYTLKFKAYKKKVTSAKVLFTDKNKNVVTKEVTIK